MYRTTAADVRNAFAAFKRAAERAGINRKAGYADDAPTLTADTLRLVGGQPSYGRSFAIFYVDPETGGHSSSPWGEIGITKADAVRTLWAITTAIDETADAVRGYPERG